MPLKVIDKTGRLPKNPKDWPAELKRAIAECCCADESSSSSSDNPLIECVTFNCLYNQRLSEQWTVTIDGCSGLGQEIFLGGINDGTTLTGCDNVCIDDQFGDWKFDEHDVSIQAGCVAGGDNMQGWNNSVITDECIGFLSLGICCITRDNGESYISVSAYLQLVNEAIGSTVSAYAYKTRSFTVSTDGTYTYISFSGLSPYQSIIGIPACCSSPTLNMTLRLKVNGALCL